MSSIDAKAFLAQSLTLYRRTLLEDIIPFWMKHGRDNQYGGISNLIDDAGQAFSHEKFLWSQGRALWTFSALCRRIQNRPDWLDFAHHIYQYLSTHGRDAQGRWIYRLDQNGQTLDADKSIYVDGFALSGLTEYHALTGSKPALNLALETYRNVADRLARPSSYGVAPYEIPAGMKTHGIAMLFSFYFHQLGQIANRPDILAHAKKLSDEILDHFYVPQKNAILEFVALDGSYIDSPQGRACVMGHAIEDLWFQLDIDQSTGRTDRNAACCRLIRRHLELAWDNKNGGLNLALDIDGKTPIYWQNSHFKLWWVHVESLVATMYAYFICHEDWCLDWHRKLQEYVFAHYPVPTGEWTQWLDPEGRKTKNTLLPVKDPFHLPRALMYLINLLERQ